MIGALFAAFVTIARDPHSATVAPSTDDNLVHENDPAQHFAPLLALLETVVVTKDYTNPAVKRQVDASTLAARDAGIRPETLIAYLRDRLHQAPLSAVGDWYRSVLVERLVSWAIQAYFDVGVELTLGAPQSPKAER